MHQDESEPYFAPAGTGLPSDACSFGWDARSVTRIAKLTTAKNTTVIPVIYQAE
jgi:hypothetical protein